MTMSLPSAAPTARPQRAPWNERRMARAQAWQAHGNTMHALLYPVSNEREAMRRQGLQPKDHAKENMRRLKELAAQKAQTQILQQSATEPEPFKMQRFQGAQSQVRKWIEEEGYCMKPKGTEGGGMQRPATSGGYMRKGAGQSRGPASRARTDARALPSRQTPHHDLVQHGRAWLSCLAEK